MGMDKNRITCTLTDKELVKKVEKLLDRLIKTGGGSFVMSVPAEPNNDTDLLIAELLRRFKTIALADMKTALNDDYY